MSQYLCTKTCLGTNPRWLSVDNSHAIQETYQNQVSENEPISLNAKVAKEFAKDRQEGISSATFAKDFATFALKVKA